MIICFTVRFYNAFLFRFSFHYSRIFEKRFSRFPSPQWFIDPIMASPCISILRPPRAFPTIVTAPPLSPRANTRTTPLSAPCSKQGLTVNHDSLKCVLELWVLAGCLLERHRLEKFFSNIDQTLEQENLSMTHHASFDILQKRERGRNFSLRSCNHFNLIQRWWFEFQRGS